MMCKVHMRFGRPALFAVAALILSSVKSGRNLAQALEFSKFGDGKCMDGNNSGDFFDRFYDYISFSDYDASPSISSAEDCKSLCTACASDLSSGREFIGFEYANSIGEECYCLFDNHATGFSGTECAALSGGTTTYYDSNLGGSGEVSDTYPSDNSECWIVTADTPSETPPSMPSPSVQSPALAFSRLDSGRCRDCNGGSLYDNISFIDGCNDKSISGPEDCETICTACDNDVSNRELRGFEYYGDGDGPNFGFRECFCLFDNHGTDFDTTECTNLSEGFIAFCHESPFSGTGEVCDTDGSSIAECWVVTADILSENPSETPSSDPSESPSYIPSASPSETPSSMPSRSPSSNPSQSPSDEPSSMPSDSPSDEPSSEPSESPSDGPSTSTNPSMIPSSIPSSQPSPIPLPRIQVNIDSSMTIKTDQANILSTLFGTNGDDNSGVVTQETFVAAIATQIKSQACPASSEDFLDCQVIVKTVNGINVSGEDDEGGSGVRRSLQSTSDLVIAFEILIQAICSNSDCSDVETLGNQVYDQATGDLQDALSNGTFLNALSSDLDASADIAAILSNDANLPPTVNFDDVVIPFLERYPSLAPSGTPSCSPSASPTEKPSTAAYGVNLFYPEWMQGSVGCRNDGDEPDYMAVDPNQWLSSSLEACCKRWFSVYGYESCIGKYPTDIDDCVKLLYYPDWEGSNDGCVADGQEPYYMLGNANYFLSNSIEECCNKFYPWDVYGCMGTTPTFTNGDFYPDWEGRSNTCLSSSDSEGVVPDYMLMNQQYYLSPTLEKCCERHFFWNINKCLGSSPDSSVSGTNKWYVKWVDSACVQDCEGEGGALSCGGIADSWDKLYNSKEECCEKRLFWISNRECLSK